LHSKKLFFAMKGGGFSAKAMVAVFLWVFCIFGSRMAILPEIY
jgi:hypothetical protein